MDDIEQRLRELGDQIDPQVASGLIPASRIVHGASLRKVVAAVGSIALISLVSAGGYAGVTALAQRTSTVVASDVLAAAARTTEEQGSARIEFEMTQHSEGAFSHDITARGSGEIDFVTQRSSMTLELEAGDDIRIHAIELITEGTTTYMKGFPVGSDKWTVNDIGSSTANSALGVEQWSAEGYLDHLKSVTNEIETLGEEQLDGATVTHYRAIIDPDLAAKKISGSIDKEGAEGTDFELEFGTSEAWIDGQGRVRKTTFESSADAGDMSMTMGFTIRLFDFGTSVDIDVPDTRDVDARALDESFEDEQSQSVPDSSFVLQGREGFEGPVVGFSSSPHRSQGCVSGAPQWTTQIELVRESTQEVVQDHSLEEEGSGYISADVLCFVVEDPGTLSEIGHHPNNFVLRLRGEDGMISVPMTSVTTVGEMIEGP